MLVLDERDPAVDMLVKLAIKVTGAKFGGVSVVRDQTLGVTSLIGTNLGLAPAFDECFAMATAAAAGPMFEIDDAIAYPQFATHPMVVGAPGIRHFAGCRLVEADGALLGVLWVMHTKPRALSPRQSDGLCKLAHQVSDMLALRYRDGTTGLPNRAAFLRHLETNIEADGPGHASVGFIDLKGFRLFKAIFGMPTADHVLQLVSARLCAWAGARDLVGHIAGDRFAFALFVDPVTLDARLQRLRAAISAPFTLDKLAGHVLHARIGVARDPATDPAYAMSAAALLDAADLAAASTPARQNTVIHHYAPHMIEQAELAAELRGAIRGDADCGLLIAHYQPQVDFADGRLIGLEALIRWIHPIKGLVVPDAFIPLAENAGIINLLDLRMLVAVCADLRRWREAGLAPPPVSLNFSRGTLLHPDTFEQVRTVLADQHIDASQLELEITESRLLEDLAEARDRIAELRGLGMRVAIDDFGTGYSNLDVLTSFPFDRLKVDRRFVHGVSANTHTAGLLRLIQGIAGLFEAELLCEGVEDECDVVWLSEMGITRAQGWFFSPARPAEDIAALLGTLRHRRLRGMIDDINEFRRLLAPPANRPAQPHASMLTPFQNATRPAIVAAADLGSA